MSIASRRLAKRILGPLSFEELDPVRRALPPGVFVDVGAHHGNTAEPFVAAGWRVIAVEPDPANRAILEQRLGGYVTIDPRAIAEQDGQQLMLYTSPVSAGISTLTPFHPSHRPTATVETVRLDTLLIHEAEVTVLKTDLEGWDLPALRTFPWERLHPAAIVAEYEDRKTEPLGYRFDDLASYLIDRGYVVVASEWWPVVEYGRRHHWRRMARYPEAPDPGSWGNVIAVRPEMAESIAAARPRFVARIVNRLRC
jgi:FkbM family methyltransferase